MQVTKQLTVAIDFHSIFVCSIPWKPMATVNWLITNIFQNIFFSVQQTKEAQFWNNLTVRKLWQFRFLGDLSF